MKANLLKYCICYILEKQHRFVFDNCFIRFEDKRYKPLSNYLKFRLWLYKLIFPIIKDFREYLRWWHTGNAYIRYKSYEW